MEALTFKGASASFALVGDDVETFSVNRATFNVMRVPAESRLIELCVDTELAQDEIDLYQEIVLAELEIGATALTASAEAANRRYSVPKTVSKTAVAALKRVKSLGLELDDPTAVLTAEALTASAQVNLRTLHMLSRYYRANPTGAILADGYVHTDDLYGGEPGRAWLEKISTQIKPWIDTDINDVDVPYADGGNWFPDDEYGSCGYDSAEELWGRRVNHDEFGPCISSLHRREGDGQWSTWFDGKWETSTPLTDPYASGLIELDDSSALVVAAWLFNAPGRPIPLSHIDPEEAQLHSECLDSADMSGMDRYLDADDFAMVAAPNVPGVPTPTKVVKKKLPADGYTSDERSANARKQVRDGNGRFAEVGARVDTSGQGTGVIVALNPANNTADVKLDSGRSVTVPASATKKVGEETRYAGGRDIKPLDLSKILAKPRAVKTTPKAFLKSILPPMDSAALGKVVDDYQAYINDEYAKNSKKSFALSMGLTFADEQKPADEQDATAPTEAVANKVKPLYLALLDRTDPLTVVDLVALVPTSATDPTVTAVKRVKQEWVPAPEMLLNLKAPTAPPTVKLDDATYRDVVAQVDEFDGEQDEAVTASADTNFGINAEDVSMVFMPLYGADGSVTAMVAVGDQNFANGVGNAERLRIYWTEGKGALKIRWGQGGDFDRCVKHTSKFMGVRAKGYCANLHKRATGMWPAEHAKKLGKKG